MKHLILAAALIISTANMWAQHPAQLKEHHKYRKHPERSLDLATGTHQKFNPQERSNLVAKQWTLALDLNQGQQNQVRELLDKHQVHLPKKPMSPYSKKGKVQWMEAHLDAQIALQNDLKTVFTPEQYRQWKDLRFDRAQRSRQMTSRRLLPPEQGPAHRAH
jgi:uncharacterized protein (DUF2384 family)